MKIEDRAGALEEPGSRGKIHDRWRHGLMASCVSQRLIVDVDAELIACSTTKR